MSGAGLCSSSCDQLTLFPKCAAHSITISPLSALTGWFLALRKEDSATSLVLQLPQFLSAFPLLVRLVRETFSQVLQSHVITVQVDTGGERLRPHGVVSACLETAELPV